MDLKLVVITLIVTDISTQEDGCKETIAGVEYKGTLSHTSTGLSCQRWDKQTPHRHKWGETLPGSPSYHSNYCRNPNKRIMPWCFTTKPTVRWQFCEIPLCHGVVDECLNSIQGHEYRGTLSRTRNGLNCQRWDTNSPHIVDNSIGLPLPIGSHSNYCRNPTSEMHSPWCYTMNSSVEWEFCDIPYCNPPKECKDTVAGADYRGNLSVTKDGLQCQRWDSQVPHEQFYWKRFADPSSHNNYCRNMGFDNSPWCYTTNPDVRWQYCDVPFCGLTEASCSFNNDVCDWSIKNNSNLLWKLKKHMIGTSGSYIRFKLSRGVESVPETLEIVEIPPFKPSTTARCLTINYYTKGVVLSIGFFRGISLQDLSESLSWRTDEIIIPLSVTRYQIVISAKFTSKISFSNYEINLDNIKVEDKQCQECFQCLTGHLCIPSSKFCDMNPDCPDQSDEFNCGAECSFGDTYVGNRNRTENGLQCRNVEEKSQCLFNKKRRPWCITDSVKDWDYCSVPKCDTGGLACEFEDSLCYWKLWNSKHKWIHQYSTEIGSMALVLESSFTEDNKGHRSIEGIFYSKIQPAAEELGCVTFTYAMDGDDNRLSVYVSNDTILNENEKLFDRYDIDTSGLIAGNIATPLNTPFMVFFKGILKENQTGYIFISTINYSRGECRVQQFCDKEQYQCDDGSCVDVHNFCDFNNDCRDKSDEIKCYMNCYSPSKKIYRGTTNTTISGITCQRWDQQNPHSHTFTHMENEENYCRSPDGHSEPWCFTTRFDVRNQTCGIPPCSNYGDCTPVWDLKGTTYRGNKTKTNSGRTCQRWDSQIPHNHSLPDFGHNYCRNPGNESSLWCYTGDNETRYGYCNVPICRLQTCPPDFQSHAGTNVNICKYRKHRQIEDTNMTSGLFHCFHSTKTIPKEQVCDGFPQCPRNDDEFPCTYNCPNTCTCNGLIYKCHSPSNIPQSARVIDLSMNSVDMNDLKTYPYLVHLNLSNCSLSDISQNAFFGIRLGSVNLQSLDLSNNKIPRISNTLFARLDNILTLNISGNNIDVLTLSAFTNLNSLRELIIKNSNIDLINTYEPEVNYGLTFIDFSHNRIRKVASKALHSFISLTTIDLSHNRLTNIDYYFSEQMKYLYNLDLSFNGIQNISDLTFSDLGELKVLNIRNNKIEDLRSFSFSSCLSLEKLDISNNRIKYVAEKAFINLIKLTHLNLTNNSLLRLPSSRFVYLISLITLDLSNNKMNVLEDNAFKSLDELRYLHLNQNYLSVRKHMFSGMCRLEWLWTDSYTLCCARPVSVTASKCIAPNDKISSCEQLIDVGILGVLIWFMAIFAVVGNIFVLYYRLRSEYTNVSQGCFIVNLSVSDLMMGIYLWIIAIADLQYRNVYGYYDAEWRYSSFCTVSGIMATVSSEASVMFVLLITIERFFAVKYPFSKTTIRKVARIVSVVAWVLSFFLSTFPLLLYKDFYTRSSVCIFLPLTNDKWNGWEYSTFIFIGLNFVLFLVIIIGQFIIFKEVRQIGRRVNNDTSNRELAVFKSLSYVVLSDTLCWIPVGIIGMMALSGVEIPSTIYAWTIVLVLPVNSALNPYIYTYSLIIKRKTQKKMEYSSTVMQQLNQNSSQRKVN